MTLYRFDDSKVDNHLLQNLTHDSHPLVTCQILVDGQSYPPTIDPVGHGYHLKFSFDKLLLAPMVRVQCFFVRSLNAESNEATVYHMLSLSWHFNDYAGSGTGIQDYRHDNPTATISFKAGPATSTGFNKFSRFSSRHSEEAAAVYDLLKVFLNPGIRSVQIKLKGSGLSDSSKKTLDKIRSRLPDGSGKLLPSIGKVTEYAAFGDKPDQIACTRDGMKKPYDLISGPVKFPMVPLECNDTFDSVKQAAIQLSYSVAASEAEVKESLKLWAKQYHRARMFIIGTFPVLGVMFRNFEKLGSQKEEIHYRLPKDVSTSCRQIWRSSTDICADVHVDHIYEHAPWRRGQSQSSPHRSWHRGQSAAT